MLIGSPGLCVRLEEGPASEGNGSWALVRYPHLIFGYSRFSFVRASSILNCQSTPRCLAFVLSAQIPISDCSNANSPMRRSRKHWLVRQLSSHSAMFSQLPCFGVEQKLIRL